MTGSTSGSAGGHDPGVVQHLSSLVHLWHDPQTVVAGQGNGNCSDRLLQHVEAVHADPSAVTCGSPLDVLQCASKCLPWHIPSAVPRCADDVKSASLTPGTLQGSLRSWSLPVGRALEFTEEVGGTAPEVPRKVPEATWGVGRPGGRECHRPCDVAFAAPGELLPSLPMTASPHQESSSPASKTDCAGLPHRCRGRCNRGHHDRPCFPAACSSGGWTPHRHLRPDSEQHGPRADRGPVRRHHRDDVILQRLAWCQCA